MYYDDFNSRNATHDDMSVFRPTPDVFRISEEAVVASDKAEGIQIFLSLVWPIRPRSYGKSPLMRVTQRYPLPICLRIIKLALRRPTVIFFSAFDIRYDL